MNQDDDARILSEAALLDSPPSGWNASDVLRMAAEENSDEDNGAEETVSTMASTTADHVPHVSRPAAVARQKRIRRGQDKQSMLNMYQQQSNQVSEEATTKILRKIKGYYRYRVLPLEKMYSLYSFTSMPTRHALRDEEFEALPMILLLGPYSTGKTTFIRHTLGCDFPGIHIGPEPTSDKFVALLHGGGDGVSFDEELEGGDGDKGGGKIIKGNTLTVTPELPFGSLSSFGSAFLNHFNGSVSSSPLLRNVTIVDTPGVLSGEKQRLSRDYDFAQAAKWFADRSDMILMLFDAHKLDFSDELKDVVETIRPHNDDKIRCVLNKCDSVERDQLVRVYGSLMWSLGKLLDSPEVTRVYAGSFWDEPLVHEDFKSMFEHDEKLLMHELVNLSNSRAERKVNAMVKRIRLVKVHICILGYLSEKMPRWYGMARAREKLMDDLDSVFDHVCLKYNLSKGDMPKVDEFRKCLEGFDDFTVFPVPEQATLQKLDSLIEKDIPALMRGSGILGKGGSERDGSIRGAAKSKLRFLYELGFSIQAEDGELLTEEEEGETNRNTTSLGMIFWVSLVVCTICGGVYYALLTADLVAPVSEWKWLALPDLELRMPELSVPEFRMPTLNVPEFKMTSVIYIGGALFFLMLHFLLRTSRV